MTDKKAVKTTKPTAKKPVGRPPKATKPQVDAKHSAQVSQPAQPVVTAAGEPLKLSLGSGEHAPAGFKGVDIVKTNGVDYVQDLLSFPWSQFADNSVDEIECSNFVEHIPHGDSRDDPFFQFFDELHRILKPAEFNPANPNIPIKGFAQITCPYYSSMRAWQDPTHQRAISEASFLYLNKQWRIDNQLDHYPVECDFDFSYGYILTPEWQTRSQESQAFAMKHYINVITDIQVMLIKRS